MGGRRRLPEWGDAAWGFVLTAGAAALSAAAICRFARESAAIAARAWGGCLPAPWLAAVLAASAAAAGTTLWLGWAMLGRRK